MIQEDEIIFMASPKIYISLRKKGLWSQQNDYCLRCSKVDKPHFAKGLCRNCYFVAYRRVAKKRIAKSKKCRSQPKTSTPS